MAGRVSAEQLDAVVAAGEQQKPSAEPQGLDVLDLLDAMAGQFREHRRDILAWPWKLFCAMWIRLLEAQERERQRKEHREADEAMRNIADVHKQRMGGGFEAEAAARGEW